MKTRLLVAALTAAWSVGGVAAETPSGDGFIPVRDAVAYVEAVYRGEVVAIELDAAGDKDAHYHVDLHYPGAIVAPLELDARSMEARVRHAQLGAQDGITLGDAAVLAVQTLGSGELIAVQLDATDSNAVHYEVDVRLPAGQVARLKLDPRNGQLDWRSPPILGN